MNSTSIVMRKNGVFEKGVRLYLAGRPILHVNIIEGDLSVEKCVDIVEGFLFFKAISRFFWDAKKVL